MSSDPRAPRRGPVTLAEVARIAGVSPATASFVLSGRGSARSSGSPETKAKVRAAAEELGYVPNRNAQAMRTGRGGGIVLAVGDLADPWGVQLTNQVAADALEHDFSTLVLADERWFEYLSSASADAALVTSIDRVPGAPDQVRRLAASVQSGIVAFSGIMEPEGFDVISSTPYRAMREAFQRLRARHDRVHLLVQRIGAAPEAVLSHPRAAAFLDAAREAGDDPSTLARIIEPGGLAAYTSGQEWLTGPDRPEAVVCFTGYQALSLQMAAMQAGLRLPEDLEIIAIGDVPLESQYFGSISYYGVDRVFHRYSEVLVGSALRRGDHPGTLHTFEWEFFPGSTTLDEEPR